jgi:hypothetical protein
VERLHDGRGPGGVLLFPELLDQGVVHPRSRKRKEATGAPSRPQGCGAFLLWLCDQRTNMVIRFGDLHRAIRDDGSSAAICGDVDCV